MKNYVLRCTAFPGSHIGEAIANMLYEILSSHGLYPNKIVATVTDNAANFGKCFKDFGIEMLDSLLLGKVNECFKYKW